MRKVIFPFVAIMLLLAACSPKKDQTLVGIETPYGNIVVQLYDSTRLHKQNFIKLVQSGYYNGTLFHRVIHEFMIQGGDRDSRHAKPGQLLGDGDTNYTIPFEYVPSYLHKRGALAAARESDDVNPGKASSGTQFYIVQGKRFDNDQLEAVERKVERRTKQYILMDIMKKAGRTDELKSFASLVQHRDTAAIRKLLDRYHDAVEAEYLRTVPFRISPAQRQVYTTLGGTPHLDGAYTVFGEVVAGMDVVDKIAAVATDTNDRPVKDIPMKMKLLKK